jgi:hypothetical protein
MAGQRSGVRAECLQKPDRGQRRGCAGGGGGGARGAPGGDVLPDVRHVGRHQVALQLRLVDVLLAHPLACAPAPSSNEPEGGREGGREGGTTLRQEGSRGGEQRGNTRGTER